MATSTNPKFKQLTALQIRAVDKCLEAHCFADPQDDGRCIYESGWDDDRVAQEAIPEYPGRRAHVVGTYRIRLGYGRLAHTVRSDTNSNLVAQVNDLKARLERLEAFAVDTNRMLGAHVRGHR